MSSFAFGGWVPTGATPAPGAGPGATGSKGVAGAAVANSKCVAAAATSIDKSAVLGG